MDSQFSRVPRGANRTATTGEENSFSLVANAFLSRRAPLCRDRASDHLAHGGFARPFLRHRGDEIFATDDAVTTLSATPTAASETIAEAKSMSIRSTSVASEPVGRAPPARRGECGDERSR